MRVAELRQLLRAADPAAVLVESRVLERLIQQIAAPSGHGFGLLRGVPHRKCFVADRHLVFRHAEQDELDLEPDQLPPPVMILLARPPQEQFSTQQRGAVLQKYWRRLFHAAVDRELRPADGPRSRGPESSAALRPLSGSALSPPVPLAAALKELLGPSAFDEVREVLDEDGMLLPDADDRAVAAEFAAVYLELTYFAANLIPVYFPGLPDRGRLDALLEQYVDAGALFRKTRLSDAPEPVIQTDREIDESHDFYWRLVRTANRAAATGNVVRAAILQTRAARVAPAHLSLRSQTGARTHTDTLVTRLQAALQLGDAEAEEWKQVLPALLDKADQGERPVEAALLLDLQKVCVDHESDIYALDVVEWLLSAGRRPIKRPLPSQRIVRINRHLRSAQRRLTTARLADASRQHLARLMQRAIALSEDRLRERFRPVLTETLTDVGLRPTSPPERTAFSKLVEELLDRVTENGYLTFSDLRDAISRNQLKLPDLTDPQEFIRGDPLLRLDRRLSTLMDGVYRRGDFYVRWLQRVTSLNFGTQLGRTLMRNVVLPFGGAFLLLEVFALLLDPVFHAARTLSGVARGVKPETIAATVGAGLSGDPLVASAAGLGAQMTRPHLTLATPLTVAAVGCFLLALLQLPKFRHSLGVGLLAAYRAGKWLVVDVPAWVARNPLLRATLTSWPVALAAGYLLRPLLVCALLWFYFPDFFVVRTPDAVQLNWWAVLGSVVLASAVMNSRVGLAVEDAVVATAAGLVLLFRSGLLPGLARLIVQVFKRVTETLEWVTVTVDEWLRFRAGDSKADLAARTVLSLLWFPISYFVRFYFVVLIEPGVNPIKFPISSVAFKLMVPFQVAITEALASPLYSTLGKGGADVFVYTTVVFWLPDAFGFLVWEMKENWKLYRANRPADLRAVPVGHHGEPVAGLLRPGFHSGTVPRLFARLRDAERAARKAARLEERSGFDGRPPVSNPRPWRNVRSYRQDLAEVEEAVRRFVERELVSLVRQSRSWAGRHLEVGRVWLATNRIRVEVCSGTCADERPAPAVIEFDHHAGWIVAGLAEPGWLADLARSGNREALTAFLNALTALYKLAGADLVREQVVAALPAGYDRFEVVPRGLRLSHGADDPGPLVYDLRTAKGVVRPRSPAGERLPGPTLDAEAVLFDRTRLPWERWIHVWREDREGRPQPRLSPPGMEPHAAEPPAANGVKRAAYPPAGHAVNGDAAAGREPALD